MGMTEQQLTSPQWSMQVLKNQAPDAIAELLDQTSQERVTMRTETTETRAGLTTLRDQAREETFSLQAAIRREAAGIHAQLTSLKLEASRALAKLAEQQQQSMREQGALNLEAERVIK